MKLIGKFHLKCIHCTFFLNFFLIFIYVFLRSYDSLEYPLIFLRGEDGYAIDILSFNVNLNEYNSHKTVSS